jgi:hypothetical protein
MDVPFMIALGRRPERRRQHPLNARVRLSVLD